MPADLATLENLNTHLLPADKRSEPTARSRALTSLES
jgi:hypothetical protein